VPRQNPLGPSIHTLKKNDGQEGWVQVGGHRERVNESEYGGCILYSQMKIEE
jgi:hypothetical protein